MVVAGLPQRELNKVLSPGLDPDQKWQVIEPYWPAVRYTGYGQAVELAVQKLYEIPKLSKETIGQIQAGFRSWIKPGFYVKMLREIGGIESCQVNTTGPPFLESAQPDLLIQDISILALHMLGAMELCSKPTGITVKDLFCLTGTR